MTTLENVILDNMLISGPLSDKDASYRAVEINGMLKLEKETSVSKFLATKLESDALSREFARLYGVTFQESHQKRMNKDVTALPFNRYCDILPFNDTRVILKNSDSAYINANFVTNPYGRRDRKIIAAQGPLSNTVDHFWRMVLQEDVTLIVSVCRLEENGRSKCHQYWPNTDSTTDKEFNSLVKDDLFVKKVSEAKLFETLVERVFEVQTADKILQVRQLHFVGWPDHGVPEGELAEFEYLIGELIKMMVNTPTNEKAVVHCSAGIGRTGTTIALAHLLLIIASQKNSNVPDPKFSIFSIVRRLREHRFLMVQMEEQYIFIHTFLKNALPSLLKLKPAKAFSKHKSSESDEEYAEEGAAKKKDCHIF